MTIKNPLEWGVDQFRTGALAAGSAAADIGRTETDAPTRLPPVARIGFADLLDALGRGLGDFQALRTDVMVLCVLYPLIGLVLWLAVSGQRLDLLFPLASGFALVGPLAAVGLYEMSRRREQGAQVTWADSFGVLRSHALAPVVLLGLILIAVFALWMFAAAGVYDATLGPAAPVSAGAFVTAVLTTPAGWAMIVLGVGVGLLFAVLVLAVGAVSFPLLLDRPVGLEAAVWTSARAVAANPVTMGMWGLIVAGALVAGSVPLFLGLVVVLPVLGHATWHLYRKLLPSPVQRLA